MISKYEDLLVIFLRDVLLLPATAKVISVHCDYNNTKGVLR